MDSRLMYVILTILSMGVKPMEGVYREVEFDLPDPEEGWEVIKIHKSSEKGLHRPEMKIASSKSWKNYRKSQYRAS